ncbi:MAG: LamG-like jellyroll fold domain-containing protein [Ignavibacteria bacterium]
MKSIIIVLIIFLGKVSFGQMYWNQAGTFAGTSTSYASVPNSASLNITGSFTIEAWINPSSVTGSSKGIISKGGPLGTSLVYGLRLNGGKLHISTNGAVRLISKSIIPVNQWTHFVAKYDSSFGQFTFIINNALDTSSLIAGAKPNSNSDSLYIGISGASTPFSGKIDELRLWNTAVSGILTTALFKSSFGAGGSGFMNNLVLSMTFQNNTGSGTLLSANDFSDKGNNGTFRNVTAFDMKDRPLSFLQMNDCLDFSTGSGYLAGPDNPNISPTTKMTIECWIYPKSNNCGILYKGSYFVSNPDYSLRTVSGKLQAAINNVNIPSNDSIPLFKWTHVAFTYFGSTGKYEFFVNGKRGTTGSIAAANIHDGTDSLIVGGVFGSGFTGFMDELRISHEIKTINEINNKIFTSMNETNDNDAVLNAIYNFDGLSYPSADAAPMLFFRSASGFTFNGFLTGPVQSPVNNFSSHEFQNGYYLRNPNVRIPASGTSGVTRDTMEVFLRENISDINIFIALSHSRENNLRLQLTGPIGNTVEFYTNTTLLDSAANIVTVFDSDADSSLLNSRYLSFSPKIKPQVDPDPIFAGDNTKGKWILSVFDDGGADTGVLSGWGIQFNNKASVPFLLDCTSLLEGFYNGAANSMIPDTMRYYLRSADFPFPIIDSSKSLMSASGFAQPVFSNAQMLTNYFLVLKHRNSIETWSSALIKFSQFSNQAQYNFIDAVSKAFGNNMVQVDNSPLSFAIYGGDSNQDGLVNLSDIIQITNDATNFTVGYIPTDVNGDNIANLNDIILAFNNSNKFVHKITP